MLIDPQTQGALPPDYDFQEELIRNKLKQYQQQQYQAPEGGMVGNRYVKPHALQYLAAGLRGYMGAQGANQATQELGALRGQRQRADTADMEKFAELLRGKPATAPQGAPTGMPAGGMPGLPASAPGGPLAGMQMGGVPDVQLAPTQVSGQPAQPGNPMAAYAEALRSHSPALRQIGMKGIESMPAMQARQDERVADREFKMQAMREQQQMRLDQMAMQNASRQDMMQAQQEFQREMKRMGGGAGAQPYFQPVQTAQGVMAFNARTGRMEPVAIPGATGPVMGAQFDPALQAQLSGAKKEAATLGEAGAKSRVGLPGAIAAGEETVKLVDDLLKDPGMKQAVGFSRLAGIQAIPGTNAKNFDIRLDQLKGKQFLEAFQSLKGGGAITEMEGKKATDAIARMNASSSEGAFIAASKEFQDVVRKGVQRAKQQADRPSFVQGQSGAAPGAPNQAPSGGNLTVSGW